MFKPKGVAVERIIKSRIVVNTSIRTEERGRELLIVIPRKKSPWITLLSIFLVVPKEKRILLDELGHRVFQDCRREMTVSEIIDGFRERHSVSADYARRSVLTYLDALARKGVIGFLIGEEESPAGEKEGEQPNGRKSR